MKKHGLCVIISLLPLVTTNISEADNVATRIRHLKNYLVSKSMIIHMMKSGDCSWNGISLNGKVQIVDVFPDIKVEIVDAFPDIKLK